jgi:hypothetical protein
MWDSRTEYIAEGHKGSGYWGREKVVIWIERKGKWDTEAVGQRIDRLMGQRDSMASGQPGCGQWGSEALEHLAIAVGSGLRPGGSSSVAIEEAGQ